ncbi:hypothetical protein ACFL1G_02955 [Planctomycetota bacterium]
MSKKIRIIFIIFSLCAILLIAILPFCLKKSIVSTSYATEPPIELRLKEAYKTGTSTQLRVVEINEPGQKCFLEVCYLDGLETFTGWVDANQPITFAPTLLGEHGVSVVDIGKYKISIRRHWGETEIKYRLDWPWEGGVQ